MRKHNDQTMEHKYSCEICNLTFRCKYNFKVHYTSTRHIKKIKEQMPEACLEIKKEYNNIQINKRIKIDPKKVNLYLKKVKITKSKNKTQDKQEKPKTKIFNKRNYKEYNELNEDEMQNLIKQFYDYAKLKQIDLNNFFDVEYYENNKNSEITEHYIEIYNVVQDNDFN
jgi:hypothetical protein